jgi:hypothetical protein
VLADCVLTFPSIASAASVKRPCSAGGGLPFFLLLNHDLVLHLPSNCVENHQNNPKYRVCGYFHARNFLALIFVFFENFYFPQNFLRKWSENSEKKIFEKNKNERKEISCMRIPTNPIFGVVLMIFQKIPRKANKVTKTKNENLKHVYLKKK